MKVKIAVVILIVVCLGLGVALITEQRHRADEKKKSDDIIADQTARLQDTSKKLEDQKVVNMALEGDLKTRAAELGSLSNTLGKVIADLEKSDAQSKATAEQLRTAQAELAKKDQKINELETERAVLGKQMDQLTNSIFDLEKLIASTEKKLATEKGEKDFLVKELARLRAEKAELERQFNDLAVLRAQVSKLKEELAISRRLEFIRLNLFGVTAKGGAGALMANPVKPAESKGTNYDLNVEVRQDGGAKVVTPAPVVKQVPAPAPAPAPPAAPVAPPK